MPRSIIFRTLFVITILICGLTHPTRPAEAATWQIGAESGAAITYAGSYASSPILATGAVVVPMGKGWFLRPHLAVGTSAPAFSSIITREGIMIGKKLGPVAPAVGILSIQSFSADGAAVTPGGNVALIIPGKWGAVYGGAAFTPKAAIVTTGITFNIK